MGFASDLIDLEEILMRICLTSLLGVLAPLWSAAAQNAVTLVEDGRPRATIVLPAQPNYGERKAAEELQTYIRKTSGASHFGRP